MAKNAATDAEFRKIAEKGLLEGIEVRRAAAGSCIPSILEAAELIAQCFKSGGKLLLCGNGGSAADCQHVAAELTSQFSRELKRPGLPAIALTTDTSFLTAFANDFGFEGGFARQVQALGRQGDVLLAISTSGNSRNVLLAVAQAKKSGMNSIGLSGSGGELKKAVDVSIAVPSSNTQYIQETHLAIEHAICELVERKIYSKK